MEIALLTTVFLGAVALSFDMALAMILASAVLLLVTGIVPLHLIADKAVSQISLFPLLAIPGFIVAGELMNVTGLTQALGELARSLVGRWRGGMGLATVLACMIFGGMTGSGLAETVAIGTLMIPMLARHGYPKSFAAAIVASDGSLGPIIPPSIPMVIYASIAPTVSVAALFIGGVIPGILIGLGFMVAVFLRSRRIPHLHADPAEEPQTFGRISLEALPALMVPVIILYGTLSGLVTVTEASVLAAAYVLMYGILTRTVKNYGKRTADLPDGCPETFDAAVLRFAWRFPAESRPQISANLARYGRHLQVFRLLNDRDVAEFVRGQGLAN